MERNYIDHGTRSRPQVQKITIAPLSSTRFLRLRAALQERPVPELRLTETWAGEPVGQMAREILRKLNNGQYETLPNGSLAVFGTGKRERDKTWRKCGAWGGTPERIRELVARLLYGWGADLASYIPTEDEGDDEEDDF